jgi:hypothetical protein
MPRTTYQQKYRFQNRDRILMLQQKQYDLYCHDYITCPFCAKIETLIYIKQHLKTASCKKLQQISNYNDFNCQLMIDINELKSKLKLDELDEEIDIVTK